ncbi:MAG: hypothetical protein SFY67_03200 [Candidatus Melainabacteria bacterium]|nr:hypothetical protein [Candidatus Melainabacteria bacterium]
MSCIISKYFLCLLLALSMCYTPAFCAAENTNAKDKDKPVTMYEDEEDPAAEPHHKVLEQHKLGSGFVKVTIHVSQLAPSTVNNFVGSATMYPWPPRPPKVRYNPAPLVTDDKVLKQKIEIEGYQSRTSASDPYPQGGWRWQFAYRRALRNARLKEPTSMIGMNAFVREAFKPVKAECELVDAFEKNRVEAFRQVEDFFIENEKSIKNEAFQKNLNPVQMRRLGGSAKSMMTYAQKVPGGKWWLQVEHKMPGLTFHWYQPVTIEANKTTEVRLTESNAISIEGGW